MMSKTYQTLLCIGGLAGKRTLVERGRGAESGKQDGEHEAGETGHSKSQESRFRVDEGKPGLV